MKFWWSTLVLLGTLGPSAASVAEGPKDRAVRVSSCTIPPDSPTESEILRALPALPRGLGAFCDVFRNDISIDCQKVGETLFPRGESGHMHHCRWRCVITYTAVIESKGFFPFRWEGLKTAIIYVNQDQFHPAGR